MGVHEGHNPRKYNEACREVTYPFDNLHPLYIHSFIFAHMHTNMHVFTHIHILSLTFVHTCRYTYNMTFHMKTLHLSIHVPSHLCTYTILCITIMSSNLSRSPPALLVVGLIPSTALGLDKLQHSLIYMVYQPHKDLGVCCYTSMAPLMLSLTHLYTIQKLYFALSVLHGEVFP